MALNGWKNSQTIIFLPGILLALLGTAFAMYRLLSPDASYFLESSERILEGKSLYHDLLENNLPTIYLISILGVLLSKTTSIPVPESFFLLCFLVFNGCIFLTWKILKNNPLFLGKAQQTFLLTLLYYLLFIAPHDFTNLNWQNFGQREHFFFALILPYIAIVLNRLSSDTKQINRWLAITAGLLAGVGFSIKPYFLVLLFASELMVMWYSKTIWSWLRLESSVILLVLLLFFLGMVFITPDAFKTAPYYVDLYQAIAWPWQELFLICLFLSLIPLLLLLWFLIEKKLWTTWYFSPYFFALSMASIMLIPLGLHGPLTHRLPFHLIVLLWLWMMVCVHPKKLYSFIFFTALLAGSALRWGQQLPLIQESRDFNLKLASTVQQYAPNGGVVAPLDVIWTFPSITYTNAKQGLGINCLWYVPSAYDEYRSKEALPPYRHPNQMGKLERFFHEHLIHNLESDPPQLIILNKAAHKFWLGRMQFDFVDYLSLDPRFAALWKKYHWVARLTDPTLGFQLEFYQMNDKIKE